MQKGDSRFPNRDLSVRLVRWHLVVVFLPSDNAAIMPEAFLMRKVFSRHENPI